MLRYVVLAYLHFLVFIHITYKNSDILDLSVTSFRPLDIAGNNLAIDLVAGLAMLYVLHYQ